MVAHGEDGRRPVAGSIKSRQRVIDHGEVFTPAKLVNDMLDLVAQECERIDSRFLEPACGDGNFLAEVLRRKLVSVDRANPSNRMRWEREAILAVCSLYGIDLLADNVAACRERLLGVIASAHVQRFGEQLSEAASGAVGYVLAKNIVQGNALTLEDAGGKPITFPEWSPINGTLIKRRDFRFKHLLGHAHMASTPLFSDMGQDVYLPTPAGDFPPCHYLKLQEMETAAGPG